MSLLELFSLNKTTSDTDAYSFHFSPLFLIRLISGDITNTKYLAAGITLTSQPLIALLIEALENH